MSPHPNELDKIDWVILTTFLYQTIQEIETIQEIDDKSIYVFKDIIDSILCNGYSVIEKRESLNIVRSYVNEKLKDKSILNTINKMTVNFSTSVGPSNFITLNINHISFTHVTDYYTFRHYPMKRKFEKFVKEAIWNPNI